VDYLADVWLNGQLLGRHEGQFTPFEFDVTKLLARDKNNVLTVLIHPAPESVRKAIAEGKGNNEWQITGVIRDAYPCWKSMTAAGWDLGSKIITMGIWKDVRLVASDTIYLKNPIVLPELSPPYEEATLHTQLTVLANKPQAVKFNYLVRCLTAQAPPVTASQEVDLAAGERTVTFPVKVPHPQLWWPNGYGKQHLYELEIVAKAAHGGRELQLVRTRFGIRDLKVLANPQAADNRRYIHWHNVGRTDAYSELHVMPNPKPEQKYLMQINGRRIFARGGSWFASDLLFGRPRKPAYEYLIRSAAEANWNLFRVAGHGVVEKQVFYDLCDQYGIMLFSEFPNAGFKMHETDEALAVTAREAREILPLWMNHPSIVRYGGGNEQYIDGATSRQMAQLRAICNEVDPTRPFHDPDPETIGQRHGDYWYNDPAFYLNYRSPRLNSGGPDNPMEWTEFGVGGAASVETLKAIMPAEHLWPIRYDDPFWNFHKGVNAIGRDNWLGMPGFTRLFGEMPDLQTTVRCSQFVQAEGLRYACQSMRRFRWHRSACAMWVFNEPWPNAAHNAVVEYYGRKPMAYYYVKQAYAPIDVLAVYSSLEAPVGKPLPVELWATNDQLQPLKGYRCRYRISDVRGNILAAKEMPAVVPAEGSVKIGDVEWTPPAAMAGGVALLWVDLLDASGEAVAQHLYTFGVRSSATVKQPPLAALLRAPRTNLKWRVIQLNTEAKEKKEVVIEIQNRSPIPALFVNVDVPWPEQPSATKVPPAMNWWYLGANDFSLLPDEVRLVRMTFSADALKQFKISVGAWNAETTSWDSSAVRRASK